MKPTRTVFFPTILVVLILILAFVIYVLISKISTLKELTQTYAHTEAELQTTKDALAQMQSTYDSLTVVVAGLEQDYARAEENNTELVSLLEAEQEKNANFENQIDDISGTVGKLDKLSKIDPELLQKYSKVYFLNEHYAPEKLKEIANEFVPDDGSTEFIHTRVASFLTDLLEEAKNDEVILWVTSAYRSYAEQTGLKSTYSIQYGAGANTFSADQGYSEHQLGTTVDFTTDEIGGVLTGFQNTKAYQWLLKNAYRYGFVLSYPEENGYYMYEPWHWRFVGESLARDLHREGKHFYDLDQRTIDTYLISIFD